MKQLDNNPCMSPLFWGCKRRMRKNWFTKALVFGIILLCAVSTFSIGSSGKRSVVAENNHFFSTYDELTDLLSLLQAQHPDIFSFYSLTKTYEGRDVWLVKISDNVSMNESEPQILFMGGVHGNERAGFQAVIYSLRSIVENYTSPVVNESFTLRIRTIVNSTELFFIPMVNPDGIEAFTRKNSKPNNCVFGSSLFRGVDINRNYDYNWEDVKIHPFRYIVLPRSLKDLRILLNGSTTNYLFERTAIRFPVLDFGSLWRQGFYSGPYAFSENESEAVRAFIEHNNVSLCVDYHIYGEVIGYPQPWRYTDPLDNATFFSCAENISKINGYKLQQNHNWSNLSGNYGSWAYARHRIFSFTIELCNSSKQNRNPDAVYLLRLFSTHLLVNLYLAEKAMR
jgi:carboxypeptidase T